MQGIALRWFDMETVNADGPAHLLPRRRPGHLGQINLGQLLAIEAALLGTLAVLRQGALVVLAVAAGGIVLLLMALGRRQGRWWLECQMMGQRMRRRRTRSVGTSVDHRMAALRHLAPGLVVRDVAAADSSQVGVARDGAGWFAVAAVEPGREVRLDSLVGALVEVSQPGAALQVVIHTIPGDPGMASAAPANVSYRQLLASCDAQVAPADRVVWIAVRLDARLLAEVSPDDSADLDRAPAVTTALLRRVTKQLRRVGLEHQVLNANQLIDALVRASDVDGGVATAPPGEEWSRWRSTILVHRSFWVRGWPSAQPADALVRWLAAVPAARTDVALTLVPDGETVDLRCLFRMASPAEQLDGLCRQVVQQAREHGAELFPLDGEQAPAVYATAPTGGGAQ